MVGYVDLVFSSEALSVNDVGFFYGYVERVIDGDTFDLRDDKNTRQRVRLSCLDAPEYGQPWYDTARYELARRLSRIRVVVRYYKRDRYRRYVGEVLDHDVCLSMIQSGFAWHNRPYAWELSTKRAHVLADVEDQARWRRLGLWQDTDPVPPWLWRRQFKSSQ